jgi:hypothetical protein
MYIPFAADAQEIITACIAAYHDHPLIGMRMRAELSFQGVIKPLGEGSDDPELVAEIEDAMKDRMKEVRSRTDKSWDLAYDTVNDATNWRMQDYQGDLDMRLLLRDELYYVCDHSIENPSESDKEGSSGGSAKTGTPARWNQLIDAWSEDALSRESFETSIHPERLLEKLLAEPSDSGIRITVAQNESLPRGEVACRLEIAFPDESTLWRVWGEDGGELVADGEGSELRLPIIVSVLISRTTGYIHREEYEPIIVSPLGEEDETGAYAYEHEAHGTLRITYYGHGQPVIVGAPPADQVNALLAPETVSVVDICSWHNMTTFIGRDAEGRSEKYSLLDVGGDTPLPAIVVGDRADVRSFPLGGLDFSRDGTVRYQAEDSKGEAWQNQLYEGEDEVNGQPVEDRSIEVTEVGLEENHVCQVTVRFADGRQEIAAMHGSEPPQPPAIGQRLKAYRRQRPDGAVLISLRRGDEVVWNEDWPPEA